MLAKVAAVAAIVALPTVTASPVVGASPLVQAKALASGVPDSAHAVDGLVPISPSRVFDTRPGQAALVNRGVPVGPRETIAVAVVAPLGVAPAEIAGVALNLTVDQPVGAGFLTVWPEGDRPVASTLNFVAGQTVPNGVVVGVDPSGQVRIHNGSDGPVHVIVDVNGWIPTGAGFTAIVPQRALETRAGEPGFAGTSALGPDGRVTVDVAALLPVADRPNVTAVTVNLTATNATAATFLTAYPAGAPLPATSSVNVRRGDTVPNSAVVGLGDGGAIVFYNHVGTIDVVLDVTGYFVSGHTFKALAPRRIVDTRERAGAALGPGEVGFLKIDELAGLPRGFVGAVAVNVTVASATSAGFLTVWPSSAPRPTASSVNFAAGRIVSNTVIVGVDQDANLSVFNSGGTTDVVVDITGWFPQDALGLVADGRDMRRYSIGTDRIGLVVCQRTAGQQTDPAAALAQLGGAVPYYRWLSGGRYTPELTYIGIGPFNGSDLPFVPCRPAGVVIPPDLRGVLYDVPSSSPSGASGLAGPGLRCGGVDCSVRILWPDNQRVGRVTSNTLEVEPPATVPWFSVPVHEIGHMLNWPHSYSGLGPVSSACSVRLDGVCEYDNPVDLMSREPNTSSSSQSRFADVQATVAFNRYAAGWMAPSLVARHPGGTVHYTLVAKGGAVVEPAGEELLILPTDDPAAFVTAEVRVKSASWDPDMARYDGTLQQEGVVVHVIDQRAAVSCPAADASGTPVDRCAGLGRRTKQFAAQPNTYQHVIGVGLTVSIGTMDLRVDAGADGRYQVTVTGGAFALPPVANATVTVDAGGDRTGVVPNTAVPARVDSSGATRAGGPDDQVADLSPMAAPVGIDLAARVGSRVRRRSAAG